MGIPDSGRSEGTAQRRFYETAMIALYIFVGFCGGFIAGSAFGIWYAFQNFDPKGNSRFAKLPCPACSSRGSDLSYDAEAKKLKRKCKACGCVVIQDPYAPKLFANVK